MRPPDEIMRLSVGEAQPGHVDPPLHGVVRKQRDIFPLPCLKPVNRAPVSAISRRCRRRLEFRGHVEDEVNHTIHSLNSMYGEAQHSTSYLSLNESLFGEAQAQTRALEFIQSMVVQMGKPPDGLSTSGALQQLRGVSGYEDVIQSPGSLASFNLEAISMPDPGWSPIPLEDLWGCNGREKVEDFVQQQLLPPEEANVNLKLRGLGRSYWDPKLRHTKTYTQFLRRLAESGLVDFSDSAGREEISFFCVSKKNNKLRLIVDARRANAHFREPHYVHLATGDGLGGLSFPPGSELTVATADLKDAFYHLALPEGLRPYFTLPSARAADLGITSLNGKPLSKSSRVFPRLAVVPIGWSWALFLCQSIHETIASQAGLSEEMRIRDKRSPPQSEVCHTEYVDNLIVMGTHDGKVKGAYDVAVKALKDAGLQVHEEEVNEQGAEILGWELGRTGHFRPTRKRAWKVRLAVRGLLDRGRSSSKQLEKIIGHCSFLCLGRREAFSVFGQSYSFITRYRNNPHEIPLWRSVRKELSMFDGIIPLIQRDLCLGWSGKVRAVDASEWGLGVTISDMPEDMVSKLGSENERWRFKDPSSKNPRQQVLEEQFDDDPIMVNESVNDTEEQQYISFSNVPFSAVDRKWQTVGKHRWKGHGTLPVFEARAALHAVKHTLRSTENFGKKHLILSDSMTATCAISRGRAQSFGLRRVCAQIGALALVSNSSFHLRWIPSEWNPADNPSRGKWNPSTPVRDLSHGFSEGAAASRTFEMEWNFASQEEKTAKEQQGESCIGGLGECEGSGRGVEPRAKECKEDSTSGSESKACPSLRRTNSSRGSCSVASSPQPLSASLGNSETFGLGTQGVATAGETGRPEPSRASGGDVLRGGRCQQCPVSHCGGAALQSFTSITSAAASGSPEPQRLEKDLPTKIKIADSMGGDLPPGVGGHSRREFGLSTAHVSDVQPIPSTIRSPQTQEQGRCGPCEKKGIYISLVELCPPPVRVRDPLKDAGVRRDIGARPVLSQRDWSSRENLCKPKPREIHGLGLQSQEQRLEPVPRQQGQGVAARKPRQDACLSLSTWRSLPRLPQQAERPSGNSGSRKVEVNGKRETIPKGSPAVPVVCRTSSTSPKASNQGSQRLSKVDYKPALTVPLSLKMPVFLEIFSGSGRLAKAVTRSNQWYSLLWDISLGEAYDLRSRNNRWKITGWLRSGMIRAGHLGTPCHSFSRARDRRPGPPPLRSDEQVMGLPNLRPGDQQKVSEGNLFMRFSVQVMLLASVLCIPFTMENPSRSRIWLCPAVARMLRRRNINLFICEFCMFGTKWRKSTAFAAALVDLSVFSRFRCLGSKRGLCKRTNLPHIHLCGQTASGQWMTHIAEPYPHKLCQVVALAFAEFEAQVRANKFEQRL